MRRKSPLLLLCLFLCSLPACPAAPPTGNDVPDWGEPVRTKHLQYDSARTPEENGAALVRAIEQGLAAGDRLMIAPGAYVLSSNLSPTLEGRDGAPIVIEADGGEVVISNAPNRNVLELAGAYVILRGLTLTGGSAGLRFGGSAHHIWLDHCHIHHTGDAAITANRPGETYHHLYITDNEIDHTSGYGEGMYLGGNNGTAIVHSSRILRNHVHDTLAADQGDGIEIKGGSWGNIIEDNHVHDTKYPCILVYGTYGKDRNVVERNLCYRSGDNVMQVQGEAIVRNNVCIQGDNTAFQSGNHQGETTRLDVINNTFITTGRAVRLNNWSGKAGMIFANNACYSRDAEAIYTSATNADATVAGNVTLGQIRGFTAGFTAGVSREADFAGVSWNAEQHDARPTPGSALTGAADTRYLPAGDADGRPRGSTPTAGAYGAPDAKVH